MNSRYGFTLYQGAVLQRRLVFDSEQADESIGEPLDGETDIPIPSWGYDEGYLFALLKLATGIGIGALQDASYQPYSVQPD